MELGQAITIQVEDANKSMQNLITKIVELDEKQMVLYVHYPTNTKTRKTAFLLEGTACKVIYQDAENTSFTFPTEVKLRKKIKKIPVLGLRLPTEEEINKIQRRNYLRIDTTLDVAARFTDNPLQSFNTTTLDISGGGASIAIPKNVKLNVDETLNITIVLPFKSDEYQYVTATARVVRIIERDKGLNLAPLEFISIKNQERDHIIRYCLMKQVKQNI
ncbi:flagellar brake protein [Salirhabdus sp. Marseille-P4669]|uniref:flagellar brake protein n=1 Tax=Salirhabdus sp. Marseille-P4669 TaxID=2042310 RepID=UPI000C79D115|nr:PilZ domain-containing protein [Salirhabdus sp. Marseille-P4669]